MTTKIEIVLFEHGQKPLAAVMPLPSKLSPDFKVMADSPFVGIKVAGDGADASVTIPMQTLIYLMQKLTNAAEDRAGAPTKPFILPTRQ